MQSGEINDEKLLEELDEVLLESYPNNTVDVLGRVRDRLFDLTVGAEATKKDLAARLSSIISYPGDLIGSDVKTLEDLLAFISPPAENS